MKPTIGRIVHYTSLGSADGLFPPETQAAIVTGVRDGDRADAMVVALHVFYRTGQFDMQGVPFSENPMTRGHWNWPPRE